MKERLKGFYVGVWSVAKKLSAALGVGLGLWFLGQAGYTPNAQQTEPVLFRLRILYALVPSVCNALAIPAALAYPLNRHRHRELQQSIEERKDLA